jgi:hypothetical protein
MESTDNNITLTLASIVLEIPAVAIVLNYTNSSNTS